MWASSLQNGASCLLNVQGVVFKAVFAKTAGLSDKTAKFQECPANFVSLQDSVSDEKLFKKMHRQCFGVAWSSIDEDSTYFLHIFHDIYCVY